MRNARIPMKSREKYPLDRLIHVDEYIVSRKEKGDNSDRIDR